MLKHALGRRLLSSAAARSRPAVTLLQYEMCPFCCKVKAFLDYRNAPYRTVEVNPLSKKELKALRGEFKKVPVALLDGTELDDSPAILDRLVQREADEDPEFAAARAEFADSPRVREALEWADGKLAVLMFPNICRNLRESLQAFSYVRDVPSFTPAERWINYALGGVAMSFAAPKIKAKYGIDDERAALRAALEDWGARLGGSAFHGGDEAPDLADLAVYGVVRSVHHTDTYRELLESGPAPFREWFARVHEAVGEPSRVSRMPEKEPRM